VKIVVISLFKIVKVAIFMLIMGAVSINFVFAAPLQTSGYVQYSVAVNGQGISALPSTFTVNETAQPTSQSGFVTITLALSSDEMNFNYSRDINVSSLPEIFPYFSGLSNQSFSYQVNEVSISASIANTDDVEVSFNGTNYHAKNYQVSLSIATSTIGKAISANGNIVTLPSGLINAVQFAIDETTSINIQLLSTNLPLIDSTTEANQLETSIIIIGVLAAIVIVVFTIFWKKKHRNSPNSTSTNETKNQKKSNEEQDANGEQKPTYWVD